MATLITQRHEDFAGAMLKVSRVVDRRNSDSLKEADCRSTLQELRDEVEQKNEMAGKYTSNIFKPYKSTCHMTFQNLEYRLSRSTAKTKIEFTKNNIDLKGC